MNSTLLRREAWEAIEEQCDRPFVQPISGSARDLIKQSVKEALRNGRQYDELHFQLFMLDSEEFREPYLRQYLRFHQQIEQYQLTALKGQQPRQNTDQHGSIAPSQAPRSDERCIFCGCHSDPPTNKLSEAAANKAEQTRGSQQELEGWRSGREGPFSSTDVATEDENDETSSIEAERKLSSSTCDDVICLKVGYCVCLH